MARRFWLIVWIAASLIIALDGAPALAQTKITVGYAAIFSENCYTLKFHCLRKFSDGPWLSKTGICSRQER
jgi:hypothetical protein